MRLRNIGNTAVSRIAAIALLLMTMAAFQLAPTTASAAQATLSWSAPTTYTDGTPLSGLGGYTVHVGNAAGSYSQHIPVGNVTKYTVASLADSTTYYFAVSATDTAGTASKLSNEVSYTTPAPPPPAALYTLSASAGTGGSITPSGSVVVTQGGSQSFAITPATGYKIAAVTVDGVSVGAVASYTFSNITANHTIAASFASTAPAPAPPTATWQSQAIAPQSGTFTAEYNATPSANNINAVSGFSPLQAQAYEAMAALIRFNPAGNIDVRNGGAYTARVALPYSGGKTYRIRMVINVPTHSYDVYVTPPGAAETQIAAGYSFRTEQATAATLNFFSSFAGTGSQQLASLTTTPVGGLTATWQNQPISSQSGVFTAEYNATPSANNINAVSGFSPLQAQAYEAMAAQVRFNPAGNIDVRNGGAYTARVALPYSGGKTYRVRMVINVPAHRYDVYVTPPGAAETQIAAGYSFRTEQAATATLNFFSSFAGTGSQQFASLTTTPVGGLTASSTTWQNQLISSQSGVFTATFDLIPSALKIDAVSGFSPVAATAYTDMAAAVRFNSAGNIDARNGSTYAARAAVPYAAGKTYRFRMVISVPTRRYDVYVTPAGGTEIQLAAGYAFRTEQAGATALTNATIYAGIGSHQLLNLSLN